MDESMNKKFSDISKIILNKDRELEVINSTNKFYERRIREAEKELETIQKNISKKNKHLEQFLIPNFELLHSTRKRLEEKQRVILDAVKNQDHLSYLINKNRERVEEETQKLDLKCKKELEEHRNKYIAKNKPLYEKYEEVKNKLKLAKIEEHAAVVQLAKTKKKNALKKRIQDQLYYGFFVNLAKSALMKSKMDELEKLKIQQVRLMQKLQERKSKTKQADLQHNEELGELCSPPSAISFNYDNELSRVSSTGINVIENKLLLKIPETPILDPAVDFAAMRKRKLNEILKLKESVETVPDGILKPKSVVEPKKLKLVQFQLTEEQIEKEQESLMREEILEIPMEIEKRPNELVVEREKCNLAQFQQDEQVEKERESLIKNTENISKSVAEPVAEPNEEQVEKERDESVTEGELIEQLEEDEQSIIIENRPTQVVERKNLKLAQFQILSCKHEEIEKEPESLMMDEEIFKKPIEIAIKTSAIETNNADGVYHTKRFSKLNQNNSFLCDNKKGNIPYYLQDVTNQLNDKDTNISQLEEADLSINMDLSLNALNSSWNNEMQFAFADNEEEATDTEVTQNIPKAFSIFNDRNTTATSFQSGFSFGSKDINPFSFM